MMKAREDYDIDQAQVFFNRDLYTAENMADKERRLHYASLERNLTERSCQYLEHRINTITLEAEVMPSILLSRGEAEKADQIQRLNERRLEHHETKLTQAVEDLEWAEQKIDRINAY